MPDERRQLAHTEPVERTEPPQGGPLTTDGCERDSSEAWSPFVAARAIIHQQRSEALGFLVEAIRLARSDGLDLRRQTLDYIKLCDEALAELDSAEAPD